MISEGSHNHKSGVFVTTVHFLFLSSFQTHTHTKMVKTTIIARVSDGLPLAASMDDEQVSNSPV
jgi:hypothetical protein